MNMRLCHDVAFAMATALLDIVRPCLRPEEHRDAFSEFYQVCRAGLDRFQHLEDRMARRKRACAAA